MAAANANATGIEQGGQVIGMQTINNKSSQSAAIGLLLGARPEQTHPINAAQALPKPGREALLPLVDRPKTQRLDVVDGGSHADGFTNRWGARFEFVGQRSPGAALKEHLINHFATTEERWCLLQQLAPPPEEAHACGATKLVAGSHQPIAIQLLHINRQMGKALARIHQHAGANGVGERHHLCDGIEAAQGVADMHQRHQASTPVELSAQIIEIQLTGSGEAHMAQHGSRPRRHHLPGHQVAVVLHHRGEDLVSGLELIERPRHRYQIDGFSGIAGEHDFSWVS